MDRKSQRTIIKAESMTVSSDSGSTAASTPQKPKPVPLYYNPDSGSSVKVLDLIRHDQRIRLEATKPEELEQTIKRAVLQGAQRVLISGGDGTVALAASHLAGKKTELAVIPSGTLNHFAQRTGIPVNAEDSLDIALNSKAQPVDVGYVNDTLFINTSSVGAYPTFVRSRNYLENRMHYYPASVVAGVRRLLNFRSVRVTLAGKQLRTPLVFIGVGERELRLPTFGQVKQQGQKGLHLIAVACNGKIEMFKLVVKSIFLGIDPMQKEGHIENQLLSDIVVHFHRRQKRVHIALDGELTWLYTPLQYRLAPQEIMVAMPGGKTDITGTSK
jgi:diacylglycerol kinase family enzyme